MKRKRLLAVLLCAVLVCACFSACTGEKEVSDLPEQSQKQPQEQSDSSTQKPLRVLIDRDAGRFAWLDWITNERLAEDLEKRVKDNGGPTDVEVEFIPGTTLDQREARQMELTRLRVELMSGAGPDVIISTSVDYNDQWAQALFQFPDQAVRRGMFLKLDEYIENAQFMEWEKLNAAVMSAGSTEDGQYLLPLVYTCPLTYFLAEDVQPYPVTTTWADVISGNDPVLNTSMETCWNFDGVPIWYGTDCLSFTWKELVDHDSETLLISEEDLLQRAKEALALEERNTTEFPHFRELMSNNLFEPGDFTTDGKDDPETYQGITYSDDVTMVPLYCDEGGAVALVRAYTGIIASTERPEDAFFVLDVILSQDFQTNSLLFTEWNAGSVLPVCNELTGIKLTGVLEGFLDARSQITSARIVSPLDASINCALQQYQELMETGEATDEALAELISEAYREMKQMLDES